MNPKLAESLSPKNWRPRNQTQVNNLLRVLMMEYPEDMDEVAELVKSRGWEVPADLTPANWRDPSSFR